MCIQSQIVYHRFNSEFRILIESNMIRKELLLTNNREAGDFFGKSEKDVCEYVDIIKKWFENQVHLPETPNDQLIESFLVANKFSIEPTKEKLDMYYTIRTLLPECFQNKNPNLPHMKEISKIVYYCPLPKLTKEIYRVVITKITGDPNIFNTYNFFGHQMNINEVRLNEESILGDILIVDLEQVKMGHVVKFTPVHLRKAQVILEKVFSNRIKAIHMINTPGFIDTIVTLLKSVLKKKMVERLHIHASIESLLEHIPVEILPKDYGGEELTLQELQDLWTIKLEQYNERFDKLDRMEVKEHLRPSKLKNDDILGYHGNFKKLDVD